MAANEGDGCIHQHDLLLPHLDGRSYAQLDSARGERRERTTVGVKPSKSHSGKRR
jgi:hypothetical protein